MDNSPKGNQSVVVATEEHALAITSIYRSVQIEPQVFLDLASSSSKRSDAARQFIGSHGGFICPPDKADMKMALQNGFVLIVVQDGGVVGFNRYVTNPDTVHQVICSEFQLDSSKDYSSRDSLVDWDGSRTLTDYKTLKRVQWVDKEQALIVLSAAKAGVQDMDTGKIAWAIDSAVLPRYQRSGIGKTLRNSMRHALKADVYCVAYRMFEICRINNVDIDINNAPSEKAFGELTSKRFAYTEEDVRIRNDINITVRWNHWIKFY